MVTQDRTKLVFTGNAEIDQKLDGGIPLGALVLLEGEADAGKSIFAQHFAHAALRSGLSVAHYSTKGTIKELMSQMASLDLDVTDYFLCDRLRVYSIKPADDATNGEALDSLLEHFEGLPIDIRLITVDALTDLTTPADERQSVDFFAACKQISDLGRTIIVTMQSDADSDPVLERLSTISDTHLLLRIKQVAERSVRVMEVAKLNNVPPAEQSEIQFNVEPGFGLKVVSSSGAQR